MPSTRTSYQAGSIVRVHRAKGPDQWIYRWRESQPDGAVRRRSKVIGDTERYPTKAEAKRLVENFRSEVNAESPVDKIGSATVAEAWIHFQANELRDPDVDRSPTTVQGYLDYFRTHIIPQWGNVPLDEIKSVAVEKWLRGLNKIPKPSSVTALGDIKSASVKQEEPKPLAPGTRAKVRNHFCALFSHCIRWELYAKLNPIRSVRQSSVRQRDPDILTLDEVRAILANIEPLAIRMMVATAAASALRRSEFRGLKWEDLDLETCWFHCQRGLVGKSVTKMKTRASRKSVEMNPALAVALLSWRGSTLYPQDSDWVFASPYTSGNRPYWPESALKGHIRPAAIAAGITKRIGWHTFRHSLASLLGQQGEDVKAIQELLRHASPRLTAEVYLQGHTAAKRSALDRVSGIFLIEAKAS
jgi:integrase